MLKQPVKLLMAIGITLSIFAGNTCTAVRAEADPTQIPQGETMTAHNSNPNATTLVTIPDVIAPKDIRIFGSAPKLTYECISPTQPRRFMLIFHAGDDVLAGVADFANKEKVMGGNFEAIGALQQTALAYFDRQERVYHTIHVDEQAEVVSMTGNVSMRDGKYVVHSHAVVSLPEGKTLGGHVLYASVWPTIELFFTESEKQINRTNYDEESGLSLIKPQI
jgi:predicted DNA-binding protein with PD1-like motif